MYHLCIERVLFEWGKNLKTSCMHAYTCELVIIQFISIQKVLRNLIVATCGFKLALSKLQTI